MSGAKNSAHIDAVFGASGSGKSSLMKIETIRARPSRLLVWDPKAEYHAKLFGPAFRGLEALARAMWEHDRFAYTFKPELSRKRMREQFNVFCQLANRRGNLRVIADELADVTEPGWAPEGWEVITRQGRHAGLVVQGASQRPADVDKSFYGNCSRLVVFRLNAEGDLARCAAALGKQKSEISALAPLEYFERDMRSGVVVKKKIGRRDFSVLGA